MAAIRTKVGNYPDWGIKMRYNSFSIYTMQWLGMVWETTGRERRSAVLTARGDSNASAVH